MKRLIPLVLVLFVVAVPTALADDGSNPPAAPAAQQGQRDGAHGRLERIRAHVRRAEHRFAQKCGTSSNGASQECVQFAQKVLDRLQKLDAKLDDVIAKVQQKCSASGADADKCQKRVAMLQDLKQRVEKLAAKVQAWLNGQTVSGSSSLGSLAGDASSLQTSP